MLREYTEAYRQSASNIEEQAAMQEQELEAQAESQRSEVEREVESAIKSLRGEISGLEVEHQNIAQRIRQAARQELRKRGLPLYEPKDLQTEEQLKGLESAVSSVMATGRIAKEDIQAQREAALKEINLYLTEAKGSVKTAKEEAIQEAKEYYEEESRKFESENIQLGDNTWVDKDKFNAYFDDMDTESASKYKNIALTNGLDAMTTELKKDYEASIVSSTPVIPDSLIQYYDSTTKTLNIGDAIVSGNVTDSEIYKNAGFDVTQEKINEIVGGNNKFKEEHVELSTGEYVDRVSYDSLPQAKQIELNTLGVDAFNTKQVELDTEFKNTHTKLMTGEYVSNDMISQLDVNDRNLLIGMGVDDFNDIVTERDEMFKEKNVEIADGIWVDKDFWNELPENKKDDARQQIATTGEYIPEPSVIVETPNGKKEFAQSEWDDLSELKQLEVSMGRIPKQSEYESYILYKDLVMPGVITEKQLESFYTIPVIPSMIASIQKTQPGMQVFEIIDGYRNQAAKEWEDTYPDIQWLGVTRATDEMLPAVSSLIYNTYEPDVYEKPSTKEWVMTGINAALLTMPYWSKYVGKLINKVKLIAPTKSRPFIEKRLPFSGIELQKPITRTGLKLKFQSPVVRVGEGFYKAPIKLQKPLTVKIGNALEMLGLPENLSKSAVTIGKANRALTTLEKRASGALIGGKTSGKVTVGETTIDDILRGDIFSTEYSKLASGTKGYNISAISNKIQVLRQTLSNAEKTFATELSNLKSVNSQQLKLLEKVSGKTGLADAFTKYINANVSYNKVVSEVPDMFNPKGKGSVKDVELARKEMQLAESKLDMIISPRIKQYDIGYEPPLPKERRYFSMEDIYENTAEYMSKKTTQTTKTHGSMKEIGEVEEWTYRAGGDKEWWGDQFTKLKVDKPLMDTGTPSGYKPSVTDVTKYKPEIVFSENIIKAPEPFGYTGSRMGELGGAYKPMGSSVLEGGFSGGVRTPLSMESGEAISGGGLTKAIQSPLSDIGKEQGLPSWLQRASVTGKIPTKLANTNTLASLYGKPLLTVGMMQDIGVTAEQLIGIEAFTDTQVNAIAVLNDMTVEQVLASPVIYAIPVQRLVISNEQLQGIEPLTENQIDVLMQTGVLTSAEIDTAIRTGEITELLNKVMTTTEIITMPSTELEILPEVMPSVTTEALIKTEAETAIERATDIDTAIETATEAATEVKTETATKVATEVIKPVEPGITEITKVPVKIIPSMDKVRTVSAKTHKPVAGTYIWKMGEPYGGGMWYAIKPPYEGKDDFYVIRGKPQGITKDYKGKGSAYRTFQVIGGEIPDDTPPIQLDTGAILINIDGYNIDFDQDPDDAYRGKSRSVEDIMSTVGMIYPKEEAWYEEPEPIVETKKKPKRKPVEPELGENIYLGRKTLPSQYNTFS